VEFALDERLRTGQDVRSMKLSRLRPMSSRNVPRAGLKRVRRDGVSVGKWFDRAIGGERYNEYHSGPLQAHWIRKQSSRRPGQRASTVVPMPPRGGTRRGLRPRRVAALTTSSSTWLTMFSEDAKVSVTEQVLLERFQFEQRSRAYSGW